MSTGNPRYNQTLSSIEKVLQKLKMAIQFEFKSRSKLVPLNCSLFHQSHTAPAVNLSEPEFPETVQDVTCYHDRLLLHTISNPKSHKVVELVRFKTVASWSGHKQQQHQQVVAKVETGEPGVYGYVCFERARETRLRYNTVRHLVSKSSSACMDVETLLDAMIEDGMPIGEANTILHMKRAESMPPPTDVSVSSCHHGSSSSSDGSSAESDDTSVLSTFEWSGCQHSDADDTVSCVSHYPSGMGVKRLETLQPSQLCLCDLAILVGAVHDLNAVYSIFHAQRLWFANLIMRIVEKETVQAQASPGKSSSSSSSSRDEVCSGVGRWYKLRVDKTLWVVVEMVRVQYHERRRKFGEKIRRKEE